MTLLQQLQNKLSTRFSADSLIVSAQGVQPLSVAGVLPYVLIVRDLCRYFCEDLSHVPRKQRNAALSNIIMLRSPFRNTSHWVVWQDGWAQVWIWDRDDVDRRIEDAGNEAWGVLGIRPVCLPVGVFQDAPVTDGFALVELIQGFELQYWARGIKRAGHWVPETPSDADIQRFVRNFGSGAGVEVKRIEAASLNADIMNGRIALKPDELWSQMRGRLFAVAMVISLVVLGFQLTTLAQWQWFIGDVEQQLTDLEQSSSGLLDSRAEVRRAEITLKRRLALLNMPSPISVQRTVYEALPGVDNLTLTNWERIDTSLSFTVEGDIPDTLGIVRSLESAGLNDVRVEPQPRQNVYRVVLEVPRGLQG